MEIKSIGIVGAGAMGGGIAQVALQYGFRVILRDVDEKILGAARARIEKGLEKVVEKGKISEGQKTDMVRAVTLTTSVQDLKTADFVIEAVPEEYATKKAIFQELDKVCRTTAILATNTSSISITKIASNTHRPDRVIGMHFMNPVPLMQLVEVVRGMATSPQTLTVTMDLARKLGKMPVESGDFPGFLANRILMPMINEAIFAVMEGVGTPEAIDTVMKLGMNHPMGPLTLADFIGLDVCLAILNVLHDGLGDPKYRPCPLLRRMVAAGQLGRKSSQGFYSY